MIKKRLVYKIYVCSFWKMQLIIVLNAKCLIMSEDEKHCTSQQTDCFVVFIYDLYTTLISNYSKFILCSYFLEKTTYTYKLSWNILFSNAAVKKNKCNLHCNYNFRKWTAEVYLSLTLCIINIYLGKTCIKSRWYLPFLPTKQNKKKIYCRFSSKYFACCECTHMYQVYNTQLAINDVWQHFKKMLACLWWYHDVMFPYVRAGHSGKIVL